MAATPPKMTCFTTRLLTLLFINTAAAYYNSTNSTCNTLAHALPGSIFYPDSTTYNASISSYPFLQLRLHPTCIVRPKSSQDVSAAVSLLRKTNTKFAVRSGGHNANVGYNNINDGVTIDLRSLNAVRVAGDKALVGAGAIWQEVYDVVEPYNLTALGGRIGVVGVGGFLTGGKTQVEFIVSSFKLLRICRGISFWSPELGWACDFVSNFEVVLANGSIVNANASLRPDLFAALKGGQKQLWDRNAFRLQTIPSRPMWGGRIQYAPEAENDLVEAFTEFKTPANFDPYAAGWVTFRYNGTTKQVAPTSILWYTKPEAKPGGLGRITGTMPQAMNGMTTAYAGQFARNASMVVKTSNFRTIWATTTFHISPTIVGSIHSAWKALVPQICDDLSYANVASELTFQSLMPPPRNGHPPNSLGFGPDTHPEKDLVFLQIVFYFEDERAMQGLNDALKMFIDKFDVIANNEGVGHKFRYLNFAAWFQEPFAGYGQDQVEDLRHVAREYDPKGFFQKHLSRGFKLF